MSFNLNFRKIILGECLQHIAPGSSKILQKARHIIAIGPFACTKKKNPLVPCLISVIFITVAVPFNGIYRLAVTLAQEKI